MESKDIVLVGVWAFAIISLLGGIAGKVDGFWMLMVFFVALIVSVGILMMRKPEPQDGRPT